MSNPAIGECINTGIAIIKKNPLYAIVGMLVVIIVGIVPFLIFPMMTGYLAGIKKEMDGEKSEIGDIFQGFSMLVPSIVAGLLGGIAVFIGMMLLVIPGLLIAPIPFIALSLVALGEKDGINALKRAWGYYKIALAPTLITFLVLIIINSIVSIIPLAGLISGPIIFAGLLHYVLALTSDETSPVASESKEEEDKE